jgi:hypothetical protein
VTRVPLLGGPLSGRDHTSLFNPFLEFQYLRTVVADVGAGDAVTALRLPKAEARRLVVSIGEECWSRMRRKMSAVEWTQNGVFESVDGEKMKFETEAFAESAKTKFSKHSLISRLANSRFGNWRNAYRPSMIPAAVVGPLNLELVAGVGFEPTTSGPEPQSGSTRESQPVLRTT